MTVHAFPRFRHGQIGYFSLAEFPQAQSVDELVTSTGWWELDQIWMTYPSQFTIVTGLAGHGKSTFLMNVVCNMAAEYGTRSFLYVPENELQVKRKLRRIWGTRLGFDYFAAEQCYLQCSENEHYDSKPHTLQWVLDKAIIAIEKDYVSLVILDPWNEIERAKPKDMLHPEYVGECIRWMKSFARIYSVAVVMVVHPTKDVIRDNRIPTLSDCEGAMAWHNKCDNGLVVYREAEKATKIISAKVREYGSGKLGTCYFHVDEGTGRFTPQEGAVT